MEGKKQIKAKFLFQPRTLGKSNQVPKSWNEFNEQQKEAIKNHVTAKFVLGCAEMAIKIPGVKVIVVKEEKTIQ